MQDPSELASVPTMPQLMDLDGPPLEAEAPGSPVHVPLEPCQMPPAAVPQNDSPLQQLFAVHHSSSDLDVVLPERPVAPQAQVAAVAVAEAETQQAVAQIREDHDPTVPDAIADETIVLGSHPERLSSTAARAIAAAPHAMHRITPPQLGSTAAHAAAAVKPPLPLPQHRAGSGQASNGPLNSPFTAAIAAASRVAAMEGAAIAAAAASHQVHAAGDMPVPHVESPASQPDYAAAAQQQAAAPSEDAVLQAEQQQNAVRNRASASTVEQGGTYAGTSTTRRVGGALAPAKRVSFGTPDHTAPLRDITRRIQSDPFPGVPRLLLSLLLVPSQCYAMFNSPWRHALSVEGAGAFLNEPHCCHSL
jgi:hypothetical protein